MGLPRLRQLARLPRLPAPYRWLLMLAGGLFCVMLGMYMAWKSPADVIMAKLQPPPTVKMTAQLLRSEDLMFIVTNRVVTQVMVEQKQDSVWAGTREGILVATTRMYYGVDIAKTTDKDIHDLGDRVVIVLPAPRVLDFAIDPNFKVITKRSGVNVALDWMYGNDLEAEMRSQIQREAMKFAYHNELLPRQATVLARLNRTAALFTSKVGKPVVFTFETPEVDAEPTSQPTTQSTQSEQSTQSNETSRPADTSTSQPNSQPASR